MSSASTTIPEVSAATESKAREHYYELVTFKVVEDKVYKVPRHGFISNSGVFQDMFKLPQAAGSTEGKADDNPVVLSCCTKPEFESLLEVLYPSMKFLPASKMTKEEWISVLKLATFWDMQEVRSFAIENLSSMRQIHALEKIKLGWHYKVAEWVIEGYYTLIVNWGTLTVTLDEVGDALGWKSAAKVLDLAVRAKDVTATLSHVDVCKKNCTETCFSGTEISTGGYMRDVECETCDTVIAMLEMSPGLRGEALEDAIKASFESELASL
ncbi:hypothetical protein NMY22_g15132 [Coprinellus aureogranulatus]|nr:hypothetical protein NMY22_g15132 [Coprinellus aureogranulatus]